MSKVLKLSGEQLSKKLAESIDDVSPTSKELIIGLVGYAGAGRSLVAEKIGEFLYSMGNYKPMPIKLSSIIEKWSDPDELKAISIGPEKGKEKLSRAMTLQNIGDRLRQRFQPHAVAALAVKKIIELRGKTAPGEEKIVFILDSIKHEDEVHLLRRVYDKSFRLVAVHCEREIREERLIGEIGTQAKYKGAAAQDVRSYMDRDERDEKNKKGQHVRDAFYLADFFIDNNVKTVDGVRLNDGIKRFVSLMLGRDLVRPTMHETGMFHAHAAALQSGCLSRQVGAALLASDGRVISTGTNDVPRFGGGVYSERSYMTDTGTVADCCLC